MELQTAPDQSVPTALSWKAHPLIDEPRAKSAVLCALIAGLAIGAAFSFDGLAYGLITLVVLALSLSRYFLPTRYALDKSGLEIAHLGRNQHRTWAQVQRVDIHKDGIFLSPFVRTSRLDSFRGCFLRFDTEQDPIIHFVQAHVATQ